MTRADTPIDEDRRLATLHALALQGIKAGEDFDSLVALAAEMLGCPYAALTLVGRDRLWITAKAGALPDEIDRDISFCHHTVRGREALVVADAAADGRFEASPLVTEAGIHFYAGMPIHATDDQGQPHAIGALCVLDKTPRSLSNAGHQALTHLASIAEALIAARATAMRTMRYAELSVRQAIDLERSDRTFRQAERLASMGSWRLTLGDEQVTWSDGVFPIYGLPTGATPPVGEAMTPYPPTDRAKVSAALARCIEAGEPFDLELDFDALDGRRKRVRSIGEREVVDGVPVALVGVFQDITERHQLEVALRRSADTDVLTDLCNRAAFEVRLGRAMAKAHDEGTPLLLALIDMDGFKAINDTLGHIAGDDVLRAVGRRLRAPWLMGSCPSRLGGDEFALIVDHPTLTADPGGLARRLEEALAHSVQGEDGLTIATAGTVGTAMLEPAMASLRDFIHAADVVLYAAKRRRVGERRRAA